MPDALLQMACGEEKCDRARIEGVVVQKRRMSAGRESIPPNAHPLLRDEIQAMAWPLALISSITSPSKRWTVRSACEA